MKIIFDYNRTIFDPDTDNLYPGVFELLKKLFVRHELFLISRNELSRKERLVKLNIEHYFCKVLFVEEKSRQLFEEIVGVAKDVIVVGDSIRDEIKIGNQLGLITVRLKKGKFAMYVPKNKFEFAKFEITDIRELESIILSYAKCD